MVWRRWIALAGLGLLLLSACTSGDEVGQLRADNARMESDLEDVTAEVATLRKDLRASTSTEKKALSCLRETRLTLDDLARAVQDLQDPKAVFFSGGSFRAQSCRGVLKPGAASGLARRIAAADKVFDQATQDRLTALLNDPPGQGSEGGGGGCNTNYSGCLKANASDYDCAGGSGDGPYYTGTVQVLGVDEYDLDDDGDGTGCD